MYCNPPDTDLFYQMQSHGHSWQDGLGQGANQIDCLRSGPGLHGPGSGLDRLHRSECLGQCEGGPDPILYVQVQVLSGSDLGVGPRSDLDLTCNLVVLSTVFFIYSM